WPVVQAARGGDWTALAALGASVGGNLLANIIQGWRDKTEAARQLEEQVTTSPELRTELDTLLEKLDVFTQAKDVLSETDREWFTDTLRPELAELGNLPRFETKLIFTGPTTVHVTIPIRDAAADFTPYQRWLVDTYQHLSLRGLDKSESDPTSRQQRL